MKSQIVDVGVNVKNLPFAAVGDGVADDTAAIQAGIDYVAALPTGGTLVVPEGRYNVSRPLHWTSNDVYLAGNGGTQIVASPKFAGAAVIQAGRATAALNPTQRGGVAGLAIDMTLCPDPALVGLKLVQAWFTQVEGVRVFNILGAATPYQTAFQISAGSLQGAAQMANWSSNVSVYDLQVNGSFRVVLSHVSGTTAPDNKAMVNRTNYFGGFAYGCGKDKPGSFGARFEVGDTTRVYGFALEDFATGCYVGWSANGPLDFCFEDVAVPFAFAPGITATIPALTTIG